MTFNFDDINDTNLNINEFLSLLFIYLDNLGKDNIDYILKKEDLISLQNKNYIKILKYKYSIRGTGKELIETIMSFKPVKSSNNSTYSDLFKEFWELFPSTDKHSIYLKTRVLKSNRIGCKNKYIKFIKEGTKHSDIIKALRYEIEDRKKTSGKDNKLSYMKNSHTWLSQREFEIILDTMEDNDNDWTSKTI